MMRGLADDLLPIARKIIKDKKGDEDYSCFYKSQEKNNNVIQIIEIYENYCSALGMVINQSGFQSAIAMYNEEGTQSEGNKIIILNFLYEMLKTKGLLEESNIKTCIENIIEGKHNNDNYEDLFKEASIALKRAIRTFEIVKK